MSAVFSVTGQTPSHVQYLLGIVLIINATALASGPRNTCIPLSLESARFLLAALINYQMPARRNH